MSKKIAIGLLAATSVGIAACGGSSNGGALENAVKDALKSDLVSSEMPFAVEPDLVDCVATAVLSDKDSKAQLQKAFDKGLKGEKLMGSTGDPSTTGPLFREMISCFDSTQLVEMMVTSMVEANKVTDDKKKCLADEFDKLDKEVLVDGFIALTNDDKSNDGASKITAAAVSCFGLDSFG